MAAVFSTQYQAPGVNTGSVTINSVVTPASFPFIIVCVGQGGNSTNVASVKYNGTTLTQLIQGTASVGATTAFWSDVWYYAAPPASTTASVVVTLTGVTTNSTVQVITASGVKASSPIGANPTPSTGASATGTGGINITSTFAGSLIVNFLAQDAFWGPTSITATGTNQTQRGTSQTATNAPDTSVSTQTTTAPATYTDTWTWGIGSNTSAYVMSLIEVLANDLSTSSPFDSSAATDVIGQVMVPWVVDETNNQNWIPGLKIWTP